MSFFDFPFRFAKKITCMQYSYFLRHPRYAKPAVNVAAKALGSVPQKRGFVATENRKGGGTYKRYESLEENRRFP